MTDFSEAPASLWSPPDGPLPNLAINTKPALLPISQLTWEDTERLFARLLETEVDVERATLFGLPGQAQAGIDVYGRLTPAVGAVPGPAASFVALQSRRVAKVTAAAIEKAVKDFLAGDWADRSARFYYATSSSLRDTKVDAAVRAATDNLSTRGIVFVPWGVEELSSRLRDHPRIVDDFFGRDWAEMFCGAERLQELSRRITAAQARQLRAVLGSLYRGAFLAHGASPTVTAAAALPYMVLDTVAITTEAERPAAPGGDAEEPAELAPGDDRFAAYSFVRRRTTPPRRIHGATLSSETMASRTPADEWMASARQRLLIGAPGSGKSSFLMFAANDLLSTNPQSAALQRTHVGALPLWLPFAFLCRHLDESTSHSVVSAVRAWITQQGGEQTWSIIKPSLDDDRVVLLVDGVDEWNDLTKADQALGLVESFVTHRNISAILSARPYALTRLSWTLPWEKAALAPLTSTQKLSLAHRALAEAEAGATATDAELSSPAAETFLAELDRVRALQPLTATPLFLSVLAKSWRGEALSPQRFRLFSDLVRLLIDRHPQMRRRASSATGSEFPAAHMLTVLRGVAYRARLETSSALTTRSEMEKWFRVELTAPDGLGYPQPEANRIAHAVLSQAEDEYGLLVPQGIGMVGFLHRVLLDQLAGEHLATLPPDELSVCLRARAGDPNWRDVLIAGLSAQVSAHMNATLLDELSTDPTIEDVDKWELIAAAIAADVAISSARQSAWVNEIVARTTGHQDGAHRTELVSSLVAMTRHPALRARLLPVFLRWLSASHPEPVSPIWALRDTPIDHADALTTLLWALRHEDDNVRLNAAHAIATRFAGDLNVKANVVERIHDGATSTEQAFALLSLGTGWPDAAELPKLLLWARAQPTPALRVCALHIATAASDSESSEVTDAELRWLQGFLRREGFRQHDYWMRLATPLITSAVQSQSGVRTFILDTLTSNGRNGGNRNLAWHLACTTFRDDNAIRDWAATQLGDPKKRGLILYDLTLIPDVWRVEPNFARSLAVTVRRGVATPPYIEDVVGLSTSMPDEEAFDALLPALDSFRPVVAATALIDRFGDDPRALGPIQDRLSGEYDTAAKLAPVATTALGADVGFDRLVELLRIERQSTDGEDRVVIAMAVADAWLALQRAPQDTTTKAILGRYDEEELARRCTSVSTRRLTWHVGSVIAAWPRHPAVVEFALEALRHPRSLTRGIVDPAPAAILRAYAPARDTTARDMVTAVLDQLAYLPPDTREVLTVALTDSDLSPASLTELLCDWDYDSDIWVQRAAITGLVRRMSRYRLSADADPAQIDSVDAWLREQIRAQLCAYGPDYEDRRQNAWVAMLLLGDLSLHDGLYETIGEPGRPGVRLTHFLGGVDLEFVDLVNANWATLSGHFGEDELFLLLSNVHAKDRNKNSLSDARRQVLLDLTQAPSLHPYIHDLIVTTAESDSDFRSSPAFLTWSHRAGRKDPALFEACLRALPTGRRFDDDPDGLYEILVDAKAWDVPDDTTRELLQGRPDFDSSEILRALYAERFPSDRLTRTWYGELEDWFRIEGPRDQRQWLDTLAIAVRASPADVLPSVVERAHVQLYRHELPELLRYLTAPLLRRLRDDPEAAKQTKAAMRNPLTARPETSLWQSLGRQDMPTAEDAARRSYLHARSLQRAGALDVQSAAEIRSMLLTVGAEVVAHDPFLDVEASLRSLSGALSRQR